MSLASVTQGAGGVRTMGVIVRGDATGLSRMFARATLDARTFEKGMTGSAKSVGAGWKLASAAVVIAIVAVAATLVGAGLAAAQFEVRMRNVNSIVQTSDAGLSAMSDSVLKMSTQLPTGANDLAEGLYQVASSGFAGAGGLQVLDAAARAASAGIASSESAVTAITAVLNAYGLSATDASFVSDVLFQTVNLGVVRFEELTSVIGDVVGMAAAAKVPIGDVGAAIATMTLSGISANEAGTALNRLLQSLIQPSDALAVAYKHLGIESGASALQSLGLSGVMEKLRTATGGSVEAYLQLFPQIRAARGAFALAANEGKTYARVQGEIGDDSKVLGATQKALDQQMKATSNQWTIFTNILNADAITIGTNVLPTVTSLITVMQGLARGAVPALHAGLTVLAPMLESLHRAGVNVVAILKVLWETAEPLAAGLAKIGGAAVIGGLRAVADSLAAVTGFLADHPALIITVAALWASLYLPSIAAVAGGLTNLGVLVAGKVVPALAAMNAAIIEQQIVATSSAVFNGAAVGVVGKFRAGIAAATVALMGFGAAEIAATLGAGLLLAGIALAVYGMQNAGKGMDEATRKVTDGLTSFTGPVADEAIAQLRELSAAANQAADDAQNKGFFHPVWTGWSTAADAIAADDALTALNEKAAHTTVNLTAVAKATGLTFAELSKLQQAQGIDLTKGMGTKEAKANRDKLISYVKDLEKQTGLSSQAMVAAVGPSVEEWQALGEAVQGAQDKTRAAFAQATDVLGTWKPDIGIQDEADAITGLADARTKLNEAEKDSKSSATSLKSARQGVADAEAKLGEAQKTKAEGTLEAFYARAKDMGDRFTRNIDEAVRMGLDPAVMLQLLQEGPEQAGPILEQLVGDHSGRLITMVNDSEKALSDISARVVEQSRLTAIAVNSATDQMAKDLPKALSIDAMAWTGATAKDIADKLGLKPAEVLAIAKEFGLTITQGVQAGIDAGGGKVKVRLAMGPGGSGGQVAGAALGMVYPGYTPGRDIGYIGVSGGEAIMRPEWTRAVGPDWVYRMNKLARAGGVAAVQAAMGPYLGGFAGGGIAGAYRGSRTTVVTVPVNQTIERNTPWTIQRAYFTDPRAAEQFGDRARARANVFGG